MNKLIRLTLISTVVNNIYCGCKDCCCCCNKKSNNNKGGGGNDNKPDDKPDEKSKPTLLTEVDSVSGAITINGNKIDKLSVAGMNASKIFCSDIEDDDLNRIKCYPLSEELYRNINDSNDDLKVLHKDGDKFITVTVNKDGKCFLVDIIPNVDNGYVIGINCSDINIVNNKKLTNANGLLSCFKTIKGISKLDTEYITNMYEMFASCKESQLSLYHFSTTNVTNMKGMFASCKNLVKIDGLDKFQTCNVTDMSYMFSDCYLLTLLNLRSFDTNKCVTMESMFCRCGKLKKLILGDKFVVSNMRKDMFLGCDNLVVVITDKLSANLLTALNDISYDLKKQFSYKEKVKDGVPVNGYYRNDFFDDNYKK